MRSQRPIVLGFVAVTTVLLILNAVELPSSYVWGSDTNQRNMQELLNDIHDRTQDEGLLFSLTLHKPISEDKKRITVGAGIFVEEIGNDFLCLREIQGGAEIITCLPFQNIAGIDYINN